MTYFFRLALAVFVVGALAPAATAQTATQDVTIIVEDINEIAVSGAVTLTIDSATPGQAPDDATDNTSTYDLTTNGSSKKITGALSSAYASGIALGVLMTAPTASGTSEGAQTLGTTAVDLVRAITQVAESGLAISYTASATQAAAPNATAGETQTVTFTVTDD